MKKTRTPPTLGGLHSELVEGEALAASLFDALAGGLRETERTDGHVLRSVQQTHVVGDGADNHSGLAVLALREFIREFIQTCPYCS